MRYIALIQTLAVLSVAIIAGIGVFMLVRWLRAGDSAVSQIGNALKASPLGAPSRGLDAGISMATGREETFGGFLADLFSGSTRAANKMLSDIRQPPASPYAINPRSRT